ncbi:hypothetical protein [Psychrobacter sp. NPDC078501]|uniref:hypothetical protein n=1 Tax=Psychrobacter sp. NPDC078501 TaxID=3364495 RepID=UPI00384F380B
MSSSDTNKSKVISQEVTDRLHQLIDCMGDHSLIGRWEREASKLADEISNEIK